MPNPDIRRYGRLLVLRHPEPSGTDVPDRAPAVTRASRPVCRWPHGCGQPAAPGSHYCASHRLPAVVHRKLPHAG
jgi:hypothetical protein